jgi:carbonic anhydrase
MHRCLFLTATLVLAVAGTLAASEEPHWTYAGEEGPEHWGELAETFDLCARGANQSPVDLVAHINADLPQLDFDYKKPGVKEIHTGHAIQEQVNPGNYVTFMDQRYELEQFHFHSPSEHTITGQSFPMEVHLVHQDEANNYLVVGLMFKEGERNELMDALPSFRKQRGEDPYGDPIDFNDLITDRSDYFLYNGSLTTPPCTEGVRWVVIKQPIIASAEQIQHYHDLLGFDNNRPVQPHNSRLILE